MDADERLRRARLAAQRLMPETACTSAEEAARAVIGVQAQNLRAAQLALRSRVPGLTRGAVSAAPLLRTWTVRGTVHLIAAYDRPWLHALLAERNARAFGARFVRFGIVDEVNAMRRDVVELCAERPRDRAKRGARQRSHGHQALPQVVSAGSCSTQVENPPRLNAKPGRPFPRKAGRATSRTGSPSRPGSRSDHAGDRVRGNAIVISDVGRVRDVVSVCQYSAGRRRAGRSGTARGSAPRR